MKQGFFVFCLSCFILATAHLAAEELKSYKDVPFSTLREKLNQYCYDNIVPGKSCRSRTSEGSVIFYLNEKDKIFAVQDVYGLKPISDHALQIDALIQKYGKPSQSNEDGGIGQIIKDASKEPLLYSVWEMDNDSGIISIYTKDSFRTVPSWYGDDGGFEDSVFYIGAGHFQEVRAFLFRYTLPEVLAQAGE